MIYLFWGVRPIQWRDRVSSPKTKFGRCVSAVAIMSSLGLITVPSIAIAQSGADENERDVIVVTTQRREENLQDVPVAVTALNSEQLEVRQIRDVNDLQSQVPSVVISTGTGTSSSARIFFRGVGEDESRGAVDPAVGIYVDDIYLGRTIGSLVDLVDVQQVEVLRGPQGTLYGRNTNGGAIKITTVQPEIGEFSLDQDFGVGNFQRFSSRTSLNVPLGDSTALRVSGLYKYRDGFFTQTSNGALTGDVLDNLGLEQVFAIRGSLRQEFGENWSATATVDYTDDNTDPTPPTIIAESNDPSVLTDVDGNLFTIEPQPGTMCSGGPQVFEGNVGCFTGFNSAVESFGASLKIQGQLGAFDVTSVSAYRTLDDELATMIGFAFSQTTDQEQFSQEVLLASNFDGPFNIVGGVYYYDEDVQLDSVFFFPFSVNSQTQSFAVFGQGAFEITDQLTLTGGLRFTTEEREFSGDTGAPGAATVTLPLVETLETDDVTYTAKLDYAITDDILIYGSFATGFKSPGFSPDCFSAAACFLPVNQEDLQSFEGGFRSTLADGAATFNATFFYNDYENLQISGTLPTGGFTRINVNEARIQGIEIEATWRPVDSLDIYANGSWLDAEYESLTAAQAGLLTASSFSGAGTPGPTCSNVTADASVDLALFETQVIECGLGLELKGAPEFKFSAGFNYTQPFALGAVANDGEFSIGADLAYEDDAFSLVQNNAASLSEPGIRLNARATYRFNDNRYRVSIWGKNITDRQYFQASTSPNDVFANPPRTWGADFGVSF